jgi:hypothetical protein
MMFNCRYDDVQTRFWQLRYNVKHNVEEMEK